MAFRFACGGSRLGIAEVGMASGAVEAVGAVGVGMASGAVGVGMAYARKPVFPCEGSGLLAPVEVCYLRGSLMVVAL